MWVEVKPSSWSFIHLRKYENILEPDYCIVYDEEAWLELQGLPVFYWS